MIIRGSSTQMCRSLWILSASAGLALLTGCDGQADLGAALYDFVIDFARSALAAFLL